jgi:hypothetical protein
MIAAPNSSFLRNRVPNQLKFVRRQFNQRRRIGLRPDTELYEVEMPAFDSNRPSIFLYDPFNGARSETEPDEIAFSEPTFRHGLSP